MVVLDAQLQRAVTHIAEIARKAAHKGDIRCEIVANGVKELADAIESPKYAAKAAEAAKTLRATVDSALLLLQDADRKGELHVVEVGMIIDKFDHLIRRIDEERKVLGLPPTPRKVSRFVHAHPPDMRMTWRLQNWADVKFERNSEGQRKLIGRGGFGEVYAATLFDRQVAVKILDRRLVESEIDAFLCLVSELSFMRHPSLATFFGATVRNPLDSADETPYALVFERGERTLRDELVAEAIGRRINYPPHPVAGRRLDSATKIGHLRDLAAGLAYLDQAPEPIAFADIQPEKCIISADGRAKWIDYGLETFQDSREASKTADKLPYTHKEHYAAPEVLRERNPVNEATMSIYAFGCVMYEYLGGERPFGRYEDLRAAVVEDVNVSERFRLADGLGVPKEVVEAIVACTNHDPEKRPSSQELFDILNRNTGSAKPAATGTASSSEKAQAERSHADRVAAEQKITGGLQTGASGGRVAVSPGVMPPAARPALERNVAAEKVDADASKPDRAASGSAAADKAAEEQAANAKRDAAKAADELVREEFIAAQRAVAELAAAGKAAVLRAAAAKATAENAAKKRDAAASVVTNSVLDSVDSQLADPTAQSIRIANPPTGLADSDIAAIVARHGTRLRSIHVEGCEISDAMIAAICRVTDLEALGLVGKLAAAVKHPTAAQLQTLVSSAPKLSSLDLSRCHTLGGLNLAILAAAPNLTSLKLNECRSLNDKTLEQLGQITSLTTLSLRGVQLANDSGTRHLKNLTRLQILDVGCEFYQWLKDGGLNNLSQINTLTSLSLTKCKALTCDGFECVGALAGLTHLNVSGCVELDDTSMQVLAARCRALTSLDISHLRSVSNRGLATVSRLKRLTSLNVTGVSRLKNAGAAHIAHLQRLVVLEVGSCPRLQDAGVGHFERLPAVQRLVLDRNTELTDDCFLYVSRMGMLRSLSLVGCAQLGSAAARNISNAAGLEALDLTACEKIDGIALGHIATMRQLKSLDLTRCNLVVDADMLHFAEHPNLESLVLTEIRKLTNQTIVNLEKAPRLSSVVVKRCVGIKVAAMDKRPPFELVQ